jgi:NAD(P)-dependent dehydrogenase (short-subunit alcohol dehydrogenase family)
MQRASARPGQQLRLFCLPIGAWLPYDPGMTADSKDVRRMAIVTGAGTGIGKAVSRRLAAQGFDVVLGGRRREPLLEAAELVRAAGGAAHVVPSDVTVAADVARLVAAAGDRLDVLVHSAGQGHCLRIDELSEQEFRETLDVAVLGAFLTAKAALPLLRRTRGGSGHIIQICSLASGGTWNREVGYGTAKAAQLKFALHLSSQLQEEASQLQEERAPGARVLYSQAVCPGTVDTPFWDRIPERSADPATTLTADEVAWVVERWIEDPTATAESLARIKPRAEVVIKRHAPFERWDNVIAIAHESHP